MHKSTNSRIKGMSVQLDTREINGNMLVGRKHNTRDADLSLFWPPFCFPVAAFT